MRIKVTYKGHEFIALADFAGLDVETVGHVSEYTSNLASELWNAIYDTRLSLFPQAEDYDTTSGELVASLKAMGLIEPNAYSIEHNGVTQYRTVKTN